VVVNEYRCDDNPLKGGSKMNLWPYRILKKDDEDIKRDLKNIVKHFKQNGLQFSTVVFIPSAGVYLSQMFHEVFNGSIEVRLLTIQRASTVAGNNWLKNIVFKKKSLAGLMRHVEVFLRLVKYKFGLRHKRVMQESINFDVKNKNVLVIDDSVDTGTTMNIIKSKLLLNGARNVYTACISNHLIPEKVHVDYSIYKYILLRTKNSRDYYAT
jgi:phosphoribosylpyrophosphate synthetase